MSSPIVLPDVSLCAIVRDEKMNPAGGIERFVQAHVPHVEEAIIVDTGSLDGTREILEELQSKYPNLKIFDRKFKGFADARNYSLKKAKTKYALVLDADELITSEKPEDEWELIKSYLSDDYKAIGFNFIHISPDGNERKLPSLNKRLFLIEGMEFWGELYECINIFSSWKSYSTIYHFIPDESSLELKYENFHHDHPFVNSFGHKEFIKKIIKKNIAPSQTPFFQEWKKYNPQRDNYN